MSKPSFTVYVGIKGEFSESDFYKLPPELRRAYWLCTEWDPGNIATIDGLNFVSFDLGRDDTADPGEYVGFGVHIFSEWYSSGVSDFSVSELEDIQPTLEKVSAYFKRLNLDTRVGVFCFAGYNS